ncbi:MAG TPA: hypothetical protein VFJ06_14070 [Halococcus sp.]|nr:hypothetical protein [Halococcus sp.]
MKHILVAVVVVTATLISGVGVVAAGTPPAPAESPSQTNPTLQIDLLDTLQDFIEGIDDFLESVVDLLETLQELFGGEGGEADD